MKHSIKFSLVPAKATDAPIRMRVSYQCSRVDIRTGMVCPPSTWDEATMRMKPGTFNRYRESATHVNARLNELESSMERMLLRLDLDGITPEPSTLKAEFERAIGRTARASRSTSPLVPEVFRTYIDQMAEQRQWSINTAKNHETVLSHLRSSCLASLHVCDLSIDRYNEYMQSAMKGLRNNTVQKEAVSLKTFLLWCEKNRLYATPFAADIRTTIGRAKTDNTINYLEWDEVLRIKSIDLPEGNLSIVRDCFCFQCFTGLRISDAIAITWQQVHLDAQPPYISVVTHKTARAIRIELNDHALDILRRRAPSCDKSVSYELAPQSTPSAILPDSATNPYHVFPDLTAYKANYYLAQIATRASITGTVTRTSYSGSVRTDETVERAEALSTHWGRHTFIVHALSLGIPPNIVMSWTGHSDYADMRPYINIVDSAKHASMSLFNSSR